jgi:release factor glutamine methyltransferase
MTIEEWLADVAEQFERAKIPTARLDAELILSHMLGVERTWLIAHADDSLARAALMNPKGTRPGGIDVYGERLVLRRLKREPIAYLLGEKEFYGNTFIVNKHVLIPRPETEALIELAKKHAFTGNIIDVGCGSGAIGLTLAKELNNADLTLSDISPEALEIVRKNMKVLKIKNVKLVESDLLEHWQDTDDQFDAIVANLPYVDRSWERSPETNFEPYQALFAQEGGLEVINELIEQTPSLLKPNGYLLLEADPEQHDAIILNSTENGFEHVETEGYGILFQKS